MCRRARAVVLCLAGAGLLAAPAPSRPSPAVVADDIAASPPGARSVTVYRSPDRASGGFDLNSLGGFALVSESRLVHLPPGIHRVRFEGVADGIEPASALVTGLEGIVEKNREGKLLGPRALVEAAGGRPLVLVRTSGKSGRAVRIPVTLRSDAEGGVLLDTPDGVEALRCSGLPETLAFSGTSGLGASPTLSLTVRASKEVTRAVTLSYLARGFDWSADYTATLSADESTMSLGAWVTLANGNGVGFPGAHAMVVAGRLNRESREVEPLDLGGPILASCWPRGSTSDQPPPMVLEAMAVGQASGMARFALAAAVPAPMMRDMVLAQKVEQEQLGDLKLYRVPETTDVSSRQSKQVRLLDRERIPIKITYAADVDPLSASREIDADDEDLGEAAPTVVLLRTMNDEAHHLGLPLPSGRVAVYAVRSGVAAGAAAPAPLLRGEDGLRDLAVGEELEIPIGESAGVRVAMVREKLRLEGAKATPLPRVPGARLRTARFDVVLRATATNAREHSVPVEIKIALPPGADIVRADRPTARKNGRPLIQLQVPARSKSTVRFEVQADDVRVVR